MVHLFQTIENLTAIYFQFTTILVNLIFYLTLKATAISVSQVNFDSGFFNIFLIFFIFSIIKIIKKSPKRVAFNHEKYEQYLNAFYDSPIHQQFDSGKNEEELFKDFLKTRDLRFCEKCLVFKVI